jgi:hypothetical protein
MIYVGNGNGCSFRYLDMHTGSPLFAGKYLGAYRIREFQGHCVGVEGQSTIGVRITRPIRKVVEDVPLSALLEMMIQQKHISSLLCRRKEPLWDGDAGRQ